MYRFLIFLFVLSSYAEAKIVKGIATSIDGQKILYTEVHNIELDKNGLNKKIETKYYDINNQLFAEMISDFSKNLALPEIKFTDTRFKNIEQLSVDSESSTVEFKITKNEQVKNLKKFSFKSEMTAGQGFDNFIKINFEKLKTTKVPLNFGVLSEQDFFSFNGYKKRDISTNKVEFGIDLSSFFLRLFSNELVLVYDSETKQILSYKGLSNILTTEGKTQSVFIQYSTTAENTK